MTTNKSHDYDLIPVYYERMCDGLKSQVSSFGVQFANSFLLVESTCIAVKYSHLKIKSGDKTTTWMIMSTIRWDRGGLRMYQISMFLMKRASPALLTSLTFIALSITVNVGCWNCNWKSGMGRGVRRMMRFPTVDKKNTNQGNRFDILCHCHQILDHLFCGGCVSGITRSRAIKQVGEDSNDPRNSPCDIVYFLCQGCIRNRWMVIFVILNLILEFGEAS